MDEYGYRDPTAVDYVRLGIGMIARLAMWACVWFIVANAVVWTWDQGAWPLAIAEAVAFPLAFFIYPFVQKPERMRGHWPMGRASFRS